MSCGLAATAAVCCCPDATIGDMSEQQRGNYTPRGRVDLVCRRCVRKQMDLHSHERATGWTGLPVFAEVNHDANGWHVYGLVRRGADWTRYSNPIPRGGTSIVGDATSREPARVALETSRDRTPRLSVLRCDGCGHRNLSDQQWSSLQRQVLSVLSDPGPNVVLA